MIEAQVPSVMQELNRATPYVTQQEEAATGPFL
jgi:hypothetical protein